MSAKQITENKKGDSKEAIYKDIALQLSKALPALKESLGEKKFDKRIKKAAKLLSEGIKSGDQEKIPVAKVPTGKIAVKKAKTSSPVKKAAKKSKTK